MAKISTYYEKKRLMEQLANELQQLEEDQSLKSDLKFEEDVKALMEEHGKSAKDVIEIMATIAPNSIAKVANEQAKVDGRRARVGSATPKRPMLRFKNPHTGEVVETRGGNHKTLNQWRQEFGKEEVKSWQMPNED
ncbi:MAG: transcriptional regulator MvaT, P16 subunit [Marinobacter sp. T13-3]|nr:MAG: transcriptional regulator MvaT, P16 subunit [Marinobacter sp. T13-3]